MGIPSYCCGLDRIITTVTVNYQGMKSLTIRLACVPATAIIISSKTTYLLRVTTILAPVEPMQHVAERIRFPLSSEPSY